MTSQKNILVGVDYSDHSQNALREAARIANAQGHTLVCYHVLDEDILGEFRKMEAYTEEGVLNLANEKMAKFIRDVIGTANQIESRVLVGHPFEATLKMIEEYQPQTLVMGSRGFSTGEHHHVGALASRCIRKAPVEVLLVRSFQERPFVRIVACVDFSETSTRAAHRAADLAQQDGAQLHLIHVSRTPVYADTNFGWLGPALPIITNENVNSDIEEKLFHLADELCKNHTISRPSTKVITALSTHEGIFDELKEVEADLVVLGTRGRTGFKKLLLGTTAEGLISRTPCSTLAVKPEGFKFSLH